MNDAGKIQTESLFGYIDDETLLEATLQRHQEESARRQRALETATTASKAESYFDKIARLTPNLLGVGEDEDDAHEMPEQEHGDENEGT